MNNCIHGYLAITCPRCNGRQTGATFDAPTPTQSTPPVEDDGGDLMLRALDKVTDTIRRQPQSYVPPPVD